LEDQTNPLECVLNDGLTICVGNPWKQISDGSVNLLVVLCLRCRYRLRLSICGPRCIIRLLNVATSLFYDGLSDVMAYSMNLM
jgi:hypothetical protein